MKIVAKKDVEDKSAFDWFGQDKILIFGEFFQIINF